LTIYFKKSPKWSLYGVKPALTTTLTIRNLPTHIYESLKQSAEIHRRSMNSEVIICLETVLASTQVTTAEKLARARAVRATIAGKKFDHKLVDEFKKAGRA
jgi:antitoxin FitA